MAEKTPEKKPGPAKVIPFRPRVRAKDRQRKNAVGSPQPREPILDLEAMLNRLGLCGAD